MPVKMLDFSYGFFFGGGGGGGGGVGLSEQIASQVTPQKMNLAKDCTLILVNCLKDEVPGKTWLSKT